MVLNLPDYHEVYKKDCRLPEMCGLIEKAYETDEVPIKIVQYRPDPNSNRIFAAFSINGIHLICTWGETGLPIVAVHTSEIILKNDIQCYDLLNNLACACDARVALQDKLNAWVFEQSKE